jgi:hypothetical protein
VNVSFWQILLQQSANDDDENEAGDAVACRLLHGKR